MRLQKLKTKFKEYFGIEATVAVNSPGRAEIIGNHTDYNLGYALGCAINQSTLALFAPAPDGRIEVISNLEKEPLSFDPENISRDEKVKWGNYIKAVVAGLQKTGVKIKGAKILLDTDFPTSGGLSSSAALELAVAFGLLTLAGQKIDREAVAWLCKEAENSDLVQSPCGFLDQGTIAFSQKDKLVLLDFQPARNATQSVAGGPPAKIKLIPALLGESSFVVAVDRTVKRLLGESGYPARRKSCEAACKTLKINSLRSLSIKDFERKKALLDPVTRKRAEHIVYENQRVLDAVKALENKDMVKFGKLLTESGQSALDLYDLAENTPELRFLVETGKDLPGVLGMRNMGGGFSATVLALVKTGSLPVFEQKLSSSYSQKFPGKLEFIQFSPGEGTRVIAY